MKLKTARILSIIAVSLQLLTLLLTLLVTLNQYAVKQAFTVDTVVLETKTIPVTALCQSVIPLVVYLILVWILFASKHQNNRMTAGALLFVGTVMNLSMFSLVSILESRLVGRTMGAEALASLSVLNQAIAMFGTPLRVIAFALFCFVGGGYWGLQKDDSV